MSCRDMIQSLLKGLYLFSMHEHGCAQWPVVILMDWCPILIGLYPAVQVVKYFKYHLSSAGELGQTNPFSASDVKQEIWAE